VAAGLRHEPWAAAGLWDRFSPLVRRILFRAHGPGHDIEELVQETFLRLYRQLPGLRDSDALRSFVIALTVRVLKGELRSRRWRRWLGLSEDGARPARATEGREGEDHQAVVRFYRLLDRLPPPQRIAFVLRHIEGLELTEVAAALGVSLATVKRWLPATARRLQENPRQRSGDAEAALAPVLELARSAQPPASPAAAVDPSYHQVRDRARGRGLRAWLLPLGMVGAVAAALAIYLSQAPALRFTVDGGTVAGAGYVQAPAGAEAAVRFSDGSEVQLERQSRGRVAWTSARGARVMLEHGRARVRVVPRSGSLWQFDAGPCVVEVTGTKFDLRWSEAEQLLEVSLTSGSVIVRGPPAPNGVPMRAGQRLVMDLRQSTAHLGPLSPAAPAAAETVTAPPEKPAPAPAPAVTRLMALAEAARGSGEAALARRALTTLRARFPGSAEAHQAAFLLGRLAEDTNNDLPGALAWYGRYLDEAPEGGFRDEALGRKMAATLRLGGRPRARPLAEEYLRRFPVGGYVQPARAILAPPR
jgi:RNA polymerase sigma-70 factor (ECF subfamily)